MEDKTEVRSKRQEVSFLETDLFMKYFFGILILMLAFTSCNAKRRISNTSDFATISSIKDLEGHFLNRNHTDQSALGLVHRVGNILQTFNIREYADFVTIVAKSPNEIKLIYYNDSGTRQERVFEGEMRENFFEFYHRNERTFIPLIVHNWSVDRLRIGRTEDGGLIIRRFIDHRFFFLFLAGAGGSAYELVGVNSLATAYKGYIPIHENGLWGFADSYGNIVIPKRYDFASIFENGVARVRLNDKWGLINEQGEEIIPVKYDILLPFDTLSPPRFRASVSGKTGIFDIKGNEIIPVIYDMSRLPNRDGVVRIRLNDKLGFADRNGVIIPAIYSRIHLFFDGNRALLERDGKTFFVDRYGYKYDVRGSVFWGTAVPIPETRRRIQFDEQRIEISD